MAVEKTMERALAKKQAKVRIETLSYRMKKNKMAYIFLAPYFILFLVFTVAPVIVSMALSFTYFNILEPPQFIGLDNYLRLFLEDSQFLQALKNTFVYAIIVGPIGYFISLFVAWFINELSPKIRAIVVLLFYAPSISGTVYLIWKLMFSSDSYGYLNGTLLKLGIIDRAINWLQNPKYILGIVIIVGLWMSLGTSFLAFVAGLQGIDRSLYEAGAVDGIKNRWQELWYITLPSMKPQLMFGAVMSITSAIGVSDIATNIAGLPSVQDAALTWVNHLIDYGWIRFEMGYASAIATVLFLTMVGINKFVQRLLRKIGS